MFPKKHTLLLGIVALTFSLCLRLLFIVESRHFPDFRTPTPGMDVQLHWNAARLLQQRPISTPAFEIPELSAPLNATFLSFSQRVLGEDLMAHRLLYAGLGSLASLLLFWFVLRLTARTYLALGAALLLGMQPSWVYLSTVPLKSAFTVGLGVAVLWTAFESTRARTNVASAGFAVLHFNIGALLFLTQGNTVFLWVVTTCYVVAGARSQRRRLSMVVVALAVCFLAAATIKVAGSRLAASHGRPAGIPQSGIHVRLGFHPGATGYYSGIRGIPATPAGHSYVARMAAEIEVGHLLTPAEANAHHLSVALDHIRTNPQEALLLTGRKVLLFFNNFAPNENYFLDELRGRSRVLAALRLGFGFLVVCATWGVVALVRRSQWDIALLLGGAVAGALAANLMTFVTSRYRISAVAPLAVLGAIGLCFLIDEVRGLFGESTSLGRISREILAPGLLAALLVFAPVVSDAERSSALQNAKANLRRSREAEPLLDRLAAIDRLDVAQPRPKKERAFLLVRLSRLTEAYQELSALTEQTPNDPQVLRQLLAMTVVVGDADRATAIARQCRQRFAWSDADFLRGQEASVRAILRRFIVPRL